jgi:hypothetical protein
MYTKQILAGVGAAVVLALTSPAYAGLPAGGAAGSLGGGFGGNLGGFGGRGISGAGHFAAQGQLDQPARAVNTKPVANATKEVDHKADNAAKSEVRSTSAVSAGAEATATKEESGSVSAMSNVAKSAPATAAPATPSKPSPAAATSKPVAPAQPSRSAGLMGSTDQTVNAGGHSVASSGSLDAQHSKGSNSVAAADGNSLN